jgi:hypothetical protein
LFSRSKALPAGIQALYSIHQGCFQFLIYIQAICAVTVEDGLCEELAEVIDAIMPHEVIAHTWRSAFYYRCGLFICYQIKCYFHQIYFLLRMTMGEHTSGSLDKFMEGAKNVFM